MKSILSFPLPFLILLFFTADDDRVVSSFGLSASVILCPKHHLLDTTTTRSKAQPLGVGLIVDPRCDAPHYALHRNSIVLEMSKDEDFFTDPAVGGNVDTSDFDIVSVEDADMSDEFIAGMQENAPSQVQIMKEVRYM